MAEFKLGRIRFVWKDAWAGSTIYYRDDVVRYAGKLYICVIGHTSASDFFTDLDIIPSKWNLMSDGQTWKGDWTRNTYYVYNDIVKYGANLFIANTVHTSTASLNEGLEDEISNWDQLGAGLNWRNEWATDTKYQLNDLVKYGGLDYICNDPHLSASTYTAGLESDITKWDVFNPGIEFKGDWGLGNRYKLNDVIRYGAGLYICNNAHTSNDGFAAESANWDAFVEGIKFENYWKRTETYQSGDIVTWGGYQYIAKRQNFNIKPTSSENDWSVFSKGFSFVGEWGSDSTLQDYRTGEVVSVGGYTYVAKVDNQNKEPGEAVDWNDYWDRLSAGFNWRGVWLDDQYYVKGDVVRYAQSIYICVESHVSEGDDYSTETKIEPGGGAENSRPDVDVNGVYWNILTIGSEIDPLTTPGDMVYYGGAGPTRLPIGKKGQVLKVSDQNIPEWTFYGQNPDVYYVSTTGIDEPAPIRGTTIESPFKSIRYAADLIEKGAKNPDARKLLELNRIFIQRETVEWTNYQISTNTAPFSNTFVYEESKCERDIGYIIDAIIYDITHGGNVKSREAALSYVNEAALVYSAQKDETIASINYALGLMNNILNQTDPDTIPLSSPATSSYQVFNGDNSTAIVEQWKNPIIESETVYSEISALVKIVTDAIAAGVDDDIPPRREQSTLIRVATGVYYEVLPIIVPAVCCIMGDELRAVTVQPRKDPAVLTPKGDVKYSYKSLEHLTTIIGNIVQGVQITPEKGNNEIQYYDWPNGTEREASVSERLARISQRFIDHKIGNKLEVDYPITYSLPLADRELGYCRDNIFLNREFIKAEVEAFLDQAYPDLLYSRTKCKQDVGYVIDALIYDILIGQGNSNWQTITAGLAYYNGNTGTLQIDSTERLATTAAYDYLRTVLQLVNRNLTVTPYNTEVSQVFGPNNGTLTVSNRILSLITDLNLTITNIETTPTIIYPYLDPAEISAGFLSDKTSLEAALPDIKEKAIDFINSNFGTFKYRSEYCRRDSGYLVDAAYYDVATGSNFWSVQTGLAYNRAQSSVVKQKQYNQELAAIDYINSQVILSLEDNTTAISRANAVYTEIRDIFINGDSSADAILLPAPTGGINDRDTAREYIQDNRDFIVATAIAVANNGFYNNLSQDLKDKCQDDLKRTLDAWAYDMQYDQTVNADGCNIATINVGRSLVNRITGETVYETANEVSASSILYTQLANTAKNVFDQIYPGQDNTAGSFDDGNTVEKNKVDDLRDIIINLITATSDHLDTLPTEILPDITWADAGIQSAVAELSTNKDTIVSDTLQFLTDNYSGFVYDHAKCSRDIEYIATAAIYDWCLDTNFGSIVTAYSYLRKPSVKVTGDQKDATIAVYEYIRPIMKDAVAETTSKNKIDYAITLINDIIFGAENEASNTAIDNKDVYGTIKTLELNKEFIAEELTNYVDNYYQTVVTNFGPGGQPYIECYDTSWMELNMPVIFEDRYDSTEAVLSAGLNPGDTYYVKEIINQNQFTVSDTPGGNEPLIGTIETSAFVKKAYVFNNDLCKRDIKSIIDAMKWDLTYAKQYLRKYTTESLLRTYDVRFNVSANYKTRYAIRYYVNSVLGSKEEDMYYLRNSTGLRLQTVDGLDGDLTPPNAYGTSRVTAGAYASLDPGWGPDDERVWILTRSPYVQNVTTFGHAAIGQKIDGALHNGGNDSMVSNDFTQVISDGIGAWITNNGRAELVSVFTYYSHIGYLAEAGGRIRATNGNNSYGTWGSVAEGVDSSETPVTAIVDNKLQYRATISNANATGDEVINLEYNHAGNNYNWANIGVFGTGINAEVYADEFRDNAVNRVRIYDPEDSSNELGGLGYLIITNTAQSGTANSITLAATDGNNNTAYLQMRVFITGGTAVGQYATIVGYDAGTKLANVVKSDGVTPGWEHVNPGTPIVNPNASSIYLIEPRLDFTEPPYYNTAQSMVAVQDTSDMLWCQSSDIYTSLTGNEVTLNGIGVTFDISRTANYYVASINAPGTNYASGDTVLIKGSNVGGEDVTNDISITITSVSSTTGEVQAIDYEGQGLSGTFIAVPNSTGNFIIQKSIDGITWSSQTIGGATTGPAKIANGILDDKSSDYRPSYTVIVAQSNSPTQQIFYSDDNSTWNVATLTQAYDSEPYIAYGQNTFFIIFENSRNVLYSVDGGANWNTEVDALPSTGYRGLAFGADRLVTVKYGTNDIQYAEYLNPGSWTAATLPETREWINVVHGNNRFIAVSQDGNKAAYSLDRGETWVDANMPNDGSTTSSTKQIKYGQGLFVAIDDTQGEYLKTSVDGETWEIRSVETNPDAGNRNGFQSVCFGNPNQTGYWLAKSIGSDTHIIRAQIGVKAFGRPGVANEKLFEVRLVEPGSGYVDGAPKIKIFDSNNIYDVATEVQLGSGVLANPTFINRGTGYEDASAEVYSDGSNGYAEFYQTGTFIAVRRLSEQPTPGSNVVFDHLPDKVFKLVNVATFLGVYDGSYTAFLNLSPEINSPESPEDGVPVTLRIRYSQVRLTGHDFLDIGTGGFESTNYPGEPLIDPDQAKETTESNGGRVFFTATDQDGNFRVGNLFNVEQSTGIATLNADAFNIAGLQELTLGEVTLGGNSATINEFSTDPFMTANSDTVIPTQRAIKAYIEAQIGGGGASLNVNSITAGDVFIGTNEISTVTGASITINATTEFLKGVAGYPLAITYLLR